MNNCEGNLNVQASFNIHKRVFGKKFNKRVSIAIKEIKKFAWKLTKCNNIRIEPELNMQICSNGSSNPPNKLKLRFSRRLSISRSGTRENVIFVSICD
ncbi:60S ribosomal protein L31 (nucleomorph) [Guillardia theta]|uniref:60S ribosomal protein L31 n=1 Tax=Guillardia theta TaxID=55529 RepID=Q98RR6_GUITH|nr:60S ribosomal protein L31 [Guillardia theta]AAK39881.1 60S ribosomal protein L31 [Guillardia theta]|mmetsp:Transcript_46196/g.144871  ORF Transcript_46196/g.144871 Transcript_46196/m.144871 type:complete len:98 (-) Transcript_46196:2662-2955(-)